MATFLSLDYKFSGDSIDFFIPQTSGDSITKGLLSIPRSKDITYLVEKLKDNGIELIPKKFLVARNTEVHGQTTLEDALCKSLYIHDSVNDVLLRFINRTPQEIDPLDDFVRESFDQIKIPYQYQKLTYEYLQRLDASYKAKTQESMFHVPNETSCFVDKSKIIESVVEAIPSHKGRNFDQEEIAFTRFRELEGALNGYEEMLGELRVKAEARSKRKMSLGMVVLLGQLSYVAYGTYHIFSWDIVEPTVYFMNLAASIVFYSMYFKIRKDFDYENIHQFLTEKELKKLTIQYGTDADMKVEELKSEKKELQKRLKNYFLNKL